MARWKIFAVPLLALTAMACGAAPKAASDSDGSNPPAFDCVDNNCFHAKVQKTESIMNHRQILPSFQKCLALKDNEVSSAAKSAHKNSLTAFSLNGDAKDVSAPLMMAMMTVASEMCLSRILVEEAQNSGRLFFAGYNLKTSGTNNNTQSPNVDKTFQELAKSCWGREMKSSELAAAKAAIASQYNRNSALFACTAVLSSTQAIRF